MNTKTLKIFGTGQITVPKKWREMFGSDTVRAVFDEEKNEIKIKPLKMVEISETKWIEAKQLEKDLQGLDLSEKFKKDLLAGYEKSDFYTKGKKK